MEPSPAQSELAIGLSTSQHTTTAAAAASWYVTGLLLSYGRPVSPSELTSSGTHFYLTPEFIRFLCSIPNSPLRFVGNQFVSFSQVGVAAIAQFFANSDLITRYLDLPQFVPRLLASVETNGVVRTYCRKRKRSIQADDEDFPLMKKKFYFQEINEERIPNQTVMMMPSGFQSAYIQGIETLSGLSPLSRYDWLKLRKTMFRHPMLSKSRAARRLTHGIENAGHEQKEIQDPERPSCLHGDSCDSSMPVAEDILINSVTSIPLLEVSHPPCTSADSEGKIRTPDIDIVNPVDCLNICASSKLEVGQKIITQEKSEAGSQGCESLPEDANGRIMEVILIDSDGGKSHKENNLMNRTRKNGSNNKAVCLIRSRAQDHLQIPGEMLNHLNKHSESDHYDEADDGTEAICPTTENCKYLQDKGLEQCKRDTDQTSEKQTKFCCEQNMDITEKREISAENRRKASCIQKNIEQKSFPDFELYIVEEEEGSGGYGTVYRARRKEDGRIFAIKCPHVNANRYYVSNEIKMLERLGGKNFVIKYENSFQSGNADFVVLEHVDHDRPEILRREMNVKDLQWYGYCLFKALAGLHKQGIVHRDVKPGNFLYSRKFNKGYLIDFNLALDMRKKYGTSDSSRARHSMNGPLGDPQMKSLPPAKSRKPMNTSVNKNGGKVPKSVLPPGNLKKEVDKAINSSRNVIKSQGADGSGITSAKDVTSTRTLSAERLREPLPSQGRKALLSLAHEAMQGGNHESANTPKSKRKRVAAPAAAATAGDAGAGFLYTTPTPMPLHANGIAIRGTGLLKNGKGDGKHKREGPCVGTKGFKAPEVLLRSLYQGPKADIWSAGVTLLYLMIGRTPFVGDAHQNIKEIAKLRGSEDLWEVAKLHNNEALFPMDLLDVKYLSPMNLRDWCGRNTKRRDMFEAIPVSLFDLVDKCLVVNPRQRISAEEALRHDFFAPCHEALRKHRRGK